jgi:serine O-acetyltransferase
MIRSKDDYLYYLEADRIARSLPPKKAMRSIVKNWLFPDYVWKFQRTLRKYEYYKNCKPGFLSKITMVFIALRFKKLSYKLGFSIPLNVFGPGLSIAHYGTIIVNDGAKVGENCRLHACVNIGTEAGYSMKAPNIGNNCYIGPGAKLYGDITIADNVAIGANAVVNKSVSESNIAIGGIPAKKISDINIFDIIIPATDIIKQGGNKIDTSGIPARELQRILKTKE